MCPHCGKKVLCSCINCTSRRANGGTIIDADLLLEVWIDPMIGNLQCPYCHKEYNINESDEYEWSLFQQTDKYKSQTNNGIYK